MRSSTLGSGTPTVRVCRRTRPRPCVGTAWRLSQGHAIAQYNLGVRYGNGVGVLKDEVEALRWYRLAAEQGDTTAQLSLGVSYASGEGVLKDSVLAHMWLNIAGANGREFAREWRGRLEPDMTRAEINHATELARTCMASDYQDCEP